MSFNTNSNFSDAKLVVEKCLVYSVLHSWTSSYIWSNIAACAVHIVFAIAGTILNSLVLYIFWKSTKMRSKLSYFVIMLLCSVDLAVVTIVHSTFLLHTISEFNGTPNCIYKTSYAFSLYLLTGIFCIDFTHTELGTIYGDNSSFLASYNSDKAAIDVHLGNTMANLPL